MNHPEIEFKHVTLGYGKKIVIADLNCSIYPGDLLGIVGPNGSGKTTILKAILGILKPQKGQIIKSNGANGGKQRMGYVPQRGQLDEIFPFTVAEVVMMARYHQMGTLGRPRPIDRAKTQEALEHLGIADLKDTLYADLSGGQKQRTLIARALAAEPDILILDEPTEGLDLNSQLSIMELIRHFHEEHQLTVVLVSHHLNVVANYVRRIALLDQGCFQIGPRDEILTEANLQQLYDMPIRIKKDNGQIVILSGAIHG
ncbi:MAG: ABC transporter ATP-binding protein [candidate division KSB1 bacterium]|nr:ABC transporter ATP-binding protein [candidate division KSB1 bacterium]